MNGVPIVNPTDLGPAINFAKTLLKGKFNVHLKSYSKNFVEELPDPAYGRIFCKTPCRMECHSYLPYFPITVFIVKDVKGKQGCSLGPLTDYIVVDPNGVKTLSLMMHEMAHCCGLWHSKTVSNILFEESNRGSEVKGFQKNLLRSSRHVLVTIMVQKDTAQLRIGSSLIL